MKRLFTGAGGGLLSWMLCSSASLCQPVPEIDCLPEYCGQWSGPYDWGIPYTHSFGEVAHAILLPTGPYAGRVLLLTAVQAGVSTQEWWLTTASDHTQVRQMSPDVANVLFCGGHAFGRNGDLFVVGGTQWLLPVGPGNFEGAPWAWVLSASSGQWSGLPTIPIMAAGRWYPSLTKTRDELLYATGGGRVVPPSLDNTYEILDPEPAAQWSAPFAGPATLPHPTVPTAPAGFAVYPYMHVLPSGRLFYSGPRRDSWWLDLSSPGGVWTQGALSTTDRRDGTSVQVPGFPGRVALIGGLNVDPNPPLGNNLLPICQNTALWVDNAGSAGGGWQSWPNLNYPRCFLNSVILPDRTLLVVGGAEEHEESAVNPSPVLVPELIDPSATPAPVWHQMASHSIPRMYHSVAILLPDGRVLCAGGKNSFNRAEIFSPPYIFKGPRPQFNTPPPSLINYSTPASPNSFTITTTLPGNPANARVALLRPGSVTHGFDFEQRYVGLGFTVVSSTTLQVTPPMSQDEAPPGWYMLFLVSEAGVPSVGQFVQLL